MEQKTPVYLRIEYGESIESKKDVLNSELLIINLIQSAKRYNAIRLEELKIKTEIYRAIKQLDSLMKETKASFPFFKIPETRKKTETEKRNIPKAKEDVSLEAELKSIREKLNSIGN